MGNDSWNPLGARILVFVALALWLIFELTVRLKFYISRLSSISCPAASKDLVTTDLEKPPELRLFDPLKLDHFILVSYFRLWLGHSPET